MIKTSIPESSLLRSLILASAGTSRNYRISFWGQLIIGSLYSFGNFNFRLVGLVIGFIIPVIWVISTYRLLKAKAKLIPDLPFPSWMKKDPGNALVIFFDIVFLSLIWFFILTDTYDEVWLKALFTIVFPLLTLIMLKNLITLTREDNQDKKDDQGNYPYKENP